MRALVLGLALIAGACSEPNDAPAPPARAGRGLREPGVTPAPVPSAPLARRAPARRAAASPTAAPSTTPPAGEAPSPPPADELPDALRRAFGTPTSCISEATRAHLQGTLRLQVQASVTSSGFVTRAYVSSAQLSPEDLVCMRRHAESMHLGTGVPDAPRSITTTVEYDVRASRLAAAGTESTEPPPPPGRVAPGTTLPAAGTETSRPPGFVPPSHTLPARVP